MERGAPGPIKNNLHVFIVELDWIFFRSGGLRKEVIQFVEPDQVTHTRFQVSGEYVRRNKEDQFRVASIFSEHDLEFLNVSNRTRLREMLKAKIEAEVKPTFVPNLGLNVIQQGVIRDVQD